MFVAYPSFGSWRPPSQSIFFNNVHNLCPARALLPGLDNFDSSLENQCSDWTESEPEGGREGYELSEEKEKVVRRYRGKRRGHRDRRGEERGAETREGKQRGSYLAFIESEL